MNFSSKTLKAVVELLRYVPRNRKQSLFLIAPLAVLAGLAELLVVASVTRLFTVVVGRANQPSLSWISNFFPEDPRTRVLLLVTFFLGMCWISSVSRLILRAAQMRLKANIAIDLSRLAHSMILSRPYEFFLAGDSNVEISSAILINISRVADVVILPLLQMSSGVFIVVLLSFGILVIGRAQAAFLILLLLVGYFVVSVSITPFMRRYAQSKISLEIQANSVLMESIKSILDIQLTHTENYFLRRYSCYAKASVPYMWKSEALPETPRSLIEPLGISLIFLVGMAPAVASGNFSEFSSAIPFLATVAVASLKLTPPLQDSFRALTLVRAGLPDLERVLKLLGASKTSRMTLSSAGVPTPEGLFPKRTISLTSVSYVYPSSTAFALSDVSISIAVGSRVAFVGPTGSGKSTTASIILGLLTPKSGYLSLDGLDVEKFEMPAWQASCSYVPQAINLINGTLLENIAFGLPESAVSIDRVWEAIENAQLLELVESLPMGLQTPVGENGILLSGGQRQRVAIARAFYRNSRLIVLDEATSSLDNKTEHDLMSAVDFIGRKCTLIIIAHRLSTVKRSDCIYEFDRGRIKSYGSYSRLISESHTFAELDHLDNLK